MNIILLLVHEATPSTALLLKLFSHGLPRNKTRPRDLPNPNQTALQHRQLLEIRTPQAGELARRLEVNGVNNTDIYYSFPGKVSTDAIDTENPRRAFPLQI